MSPDTLPAPSGETHRRDTQALQPPPPPPLIPSHPTGLRGRCLDVVMIAELWLLVRGGDGEEKKERRWEEGNINHSWMPGSFPSFTYISSFVSFWQLTAEAGPRIINFLQAVCFSDKNSRSEEQKQFNQITDRTNLSSATPCVELSDILSMIWGSHCAFSPEATTI